METTLWDTPRGDQPPSAEYLVRRYSGSGQSVTATRLLASRREVDRLRRWLSRRRYQVGGGPYGFVVLDRESPQVTFIEPSGWLLRLPSGALQAMDDEEFRSRYAPT